jgi:hypothetical protein
MKLVRFMQLFGISAFFGATMQLGSAQEGTVFGPAEPKPAPGMKVYIDPQTGAFLSEPAPGTVPPAASAAERNAFSTSHQGLVEVPSSVPGGGVRLDIQGRFQSPLTAKVGSDGSIELDHGRLDVPSDDKK